MAGCDQVWQVSSHPDLPDADDARLLVRPDFSLVPSEEPGLAGSVAETVYLGELTAVRVRLAGGHEVWMRQMKLSAIKAGDQVRLRWDPSGVRLLETTREIYKTGGKKP